MERRGFRKRWIVLVLLLVLVVGVVLYLTQFPGPTPAATVADTSDRVISTPPVGSSPAVEPDADLDQETEPATPAPISSPEPADDDDQDPQVIERPERIYPLRIRFVDTDGAPLPGYAFRYRVFSVEEGNVEWNRLNNELKEGAEDSELFDMFNREGRTDGDGYWRVDRPWAHSLGIFVSDATARIDTTDMTAFANREMNRLQNSRVVRIRSSISRTVDGEVNRQTMGQLAEVTVVVSFETSFLVSIHYDDGVPYDGIVRYLRMGGSSGHLFILGGGPIPIPQLERSPMRITATSQARLGYGRSQTFDISSDMIASGHVKLVLESGQRLVPTSGMLYLDLSELGANESVQIQGIHPSGFVSTGVIKHQGPAVLALGAVTSREGAFFRITGDRTWNSGLVIVPVGEELTLKPVFGQPGSIEIRAVDPDGNPVRGAVLRLGGRARLAEPRMQVATVFQASANADGIARLRDISPGRYEILVTARDYEPEVREVELREGQELFVGDVILRKASARLTVKLVGESGRPYEEHMLTILLVPERQPFMSGIRFDETGVVVIEGMASGRYSLLLTGQQGGAGRTSAVEVEHGVPLEVVFDLSRPPDRRD